MSIGYMSDFDIVHDFECELHSVDVTVGPLAASRPPWGLVFKQAWRLYSDILQVITVSPSLRLSESVCFMHT